MTARKDWHPNQTRDNMKPQGTSNIVDLQSYKDNKKLFDLFIKASDMLSRAEYVDYHKPEPLTLVSAEQTRQNMLYDAGMSIVRTNRI